MATLSNTLEIGRAEELQRRLSNLARQFPQMGVVKVAFTDGQHEGKVFGTAPQFERIGIHASCIAKLFTATLLSTLMLRHRIHPDDSVAALLPVKEEKVRRHLSGVTVTHLLNHTHGLDDTALGSVPLQSDGSIDCNALCAELVSTPPLFAPGVLYNYGHSGGYLAGAVVEQIYGRPFRSVLEPELLAPLGIRLMVGDRSCAGHATQLVCPSRGSRWLVTEMDVLKLLSQQLACPNSAHLQIRWSRLPIKQPASQSLPGWSPTEKSINLGWKGYRTGWFGHDGRGPQSSMLARMNVELRVALVISCVGFSGNDPAYMVLSRLLRDWFPELTQIDAPRSLDKAAAQRLDLNAFTGTYRTRVSSIVVDQSNGELFMRRGDQAGLTYRFRGAEEDLFLATCAEPGVFPYVQFIRPAANGSHEYLWNGQNVWRRCS